MPPSLTTEELQATIELCKDPKYIVPRELAARMAQTILDLYKEFEPPSAHS